MDRLDLGRTVRVGVAGHRFLAELDRVVRGIDAALQRIRSVFPGRPLTVVSALAEGADRLVAERVLALPDSRLIAALPMPQADYEMDFQAPESVREFRRLLARAEIVVELPPPASRNEAYEACALYVLDHADVLLAIWDGQGAQGQGGTAGTVGRARSRRLPIAWVHAGNRKPGTNEPTTLGAEQGKVTFENFDVHP